MTCLKTASPLHNEDNEIKGGWQAVNKGEKSTIDCILGPVIQRISYNGIGIHNQNQKTKLVHFNLAADKKKDFPQNYHTYHN